MIEGQGEDSCGKSGTEDPAGAQATGRLSGRPRKAKPCTEINCGVISGSAHVSHLFVFRWASFRYVPDSFYA
ncbi:hypothetical protein P8831_10220 [Priestia megaterium]|uniref:hypothetical protein n=1 Tax=Priestia megaterium TaxID=1404 RepID=UPI002D80A4C3|nr:hypothetical protein [Priestia megaterium]MEB4869091.1 hypothetical protein [Priestia megaterium]